MLDIPWPELVVIGAVALVAIGPKDLPKAMHTLGKWAGKARAFAHDIHRTIEQVAYEAEVAEKLKKKQAEAAAAQAAEAGAAGKTAEPPPAGTPHDPA